jgi:glycosyltransferase involved in cell wall biosynthesis
LRIEGLASEMHARGHDVVLLAAGHRALIRHDAGRGRHPWFVETPYAFSARWAQAGLDPLDIAYRLGWIRNRTFDIMHISDHRPSTSLPSMLARRSGGLFVSDWADLWGAGGIAEGRPWFGKHLAEILDTRLEVLVHGRADAVTAISTDLARRAESLGHQDTHVLRFPNGVNTELFKPIQDTEALRTKHGLPESGYVLAYTGMAPIDMDLIWDSFPLVLDQLPETTLVVTGRKWPEPHGDSAASQRVVQMGMVTVQDLAEILALADVLLLPYRNTPMNLGRWPGKLATYLAVGRPTVTNPTGDVGQLFRRAELGVLAGETPEQFAQAILLLLQNHSLRQRMGEAARELAEEEFTWGHIADQVEAFYSGLLHPMHGTA